jgi:hypothetical protein
MSTPNAKVKSGVMITPPPSPVNDPTKPAPTDASQTTSVNSAMFNQVNLVTPAPTEGCLPPLL